MKRFMLVVMLVLALAIPTFAQDVTEEPTFEFPTPTSEVTETPTAEPTAEETPEVTVVPTVDPTPDPDPEPEPEEDTVLEQLLPYFIVAILAVLTGVALWFMNSSHKRALQVAVASTPPFILDLLISGNNSLFDSAGNYVAGTPSLHDDEYVAKMREVAKKFFEEAKQIQDEARRNAGLPPLPGQRGSDQP